MYHLPVRSEIGGAGQRHRPVRGDAPAGPWWDPLGEGLCTWAVYQPKGAANFAASLVDLSGNGNNATDPGGLNTPAWDIANGWKFDGVAPPNGDYLTTTFVPNEDGTQSVFVQFTDCTDNGYILGENDGAGARFYIVPRNGLTTNVAYANGGQAVVAPVLAAGNLGIAGTRCYRNGVDEGIALAAYGYAPTPALWIGDVNDWGASLNPCAVYIQALAIYDCTLTPAQAARLAAAMAAL